MNNCINFSKNSVGRDFVIGDIHGEYSKFMSLLNKLEFNPKVDRMFSVGDLVDRGEDSESSLRLIENNWFHAVKGNHEDFMTGSLDGNGNFIGGRASYWLSDNVGGYWWNYVDDKDKQHLNQLAGSLPLFIEIDTDNGRFGIVHADVCRSDWQYAINNHDTHEVESFSLWSRDTITRYYEYSKDDSNISVVSNIDNVVVGHTPLPKYTKINNRHYIDTGAVFNSDKDPGFFTVLMVQPTIKVFEFYDGELKKI